MSNKKIIFSRSPNQQLKMSNEIANSIVNSSNMIGYECYNTLESEVLQAGSSLPPILVGHIRTMTMKNN